MKVCNICGETKPLTDYYKVIKNKRHYHGKCKKCYVKKQQERYDPVVQRDKNLKYLYGIGLTEYNQMLEEQGGCCAICKSSDPKGRKSGRGGAVENFYVDHNHKTGEVRGLLCNICNRTMGYLNEDVILIGKMIEYLN